MFTNICLLNPRSQPPVLISQTRSPGVTIGALHLHLLLNLLNRATIASWTQIYSRGTWSRSTPPAVLVSGVRSAMNLPRPSPRVHAY